MNYHIQPELDEIRNQLPKENWKTHQLIEIKEHILEQPTDHRRKHKENYKILTEE